MNRDVYKYPSSYVGALLEGYLCALKLTLDNYILIHHCGAMPFPPTIITLPANWTSPRDGQKIQCIIAHDTERPSDNSNSINYLQRGGSLPDGSDRKVSIHALIESDGTIYQMVSDQVAANHAGYGTLRLNGITYSPDSKYNINQISLGFELEYTKSPYNKPYPEVQLLSMGYWLLLKFQQYGILPIYRHADVDPYRRTDTRNLSVAEITHWIDKARLLIDHVPTPDKPVNYRFIVPQVVYIDRNLSSRFAGTANSPVIMAVGTTVPIGDITGEWAWIATGVGFVPLSTIVKL